jgi:glycerol-3-phosphate dehydrogenase
MSKIPDDAMAVARRAFPAAAPHALKAALEAAAPHIAAAERERIVAQLGRRADELASMLAIDDEADHDRNISVGALRYAIEDLTP